MNQSEQPEADISGKLSEEQLDKVAGGVTQTVQNERVCRFEETGNILPDHSNTDVWKECKADCKSKARSGAPLCKCYGTSQCKEKWHRFGPKDEHYYW